MLVLTRRKGESIVIGDAVLTLLDAGRGRVRIGIEAPAEVPIMRGELVRTVALPGADTEAELNHAAAKPR